MTANVIHKILNVIISALKLSRNKYNKIKKKLLSVFLYEILKVIKKINIITHKLSKPFSEIAPKKTE